MPIKCDKDSTIAITCTPLDGRKGCLMATAIEEHVLEEVPTHHNRPKNKIIVVKLKTNIYFCF